MCVCVCVCVGACVELRAEVARIRHAVVWWLKQMLARVRKCAVFWLWLCQVLGTVAPVVGSQLQ
jgi:hypothetical protein